MLQASGIGNGATNSQDPPAGDEVMVYLVGADSAEFAGAVNETVAVVCPVAVALTEVGAPGAVAAVTDIEVDSAPLGLDALFTARIWTG